MAPLEYEVLPGRVRFGIGALATVPEEAGRLGRRMLLLDGLTDPSVAAGLAASLGDLHAATLTIARQHVPASLASEAAARLADSGADTVIALGGGSAIGVAKILARRSGVAILAIPTTYAGSEMTPVWGLTDEQEKLTGRDLAVLPATVIYDPELTVSFPPAASGASGMNAVAHCVEALWVPGATPVSDAFALDGLARLSEALPRVVATPADLSARVDAQAGAWLAGRAFALAGGGLHHGTCHVLGGSFELPHAETHAAVLPAVTAFQRDRAPGALLRIARALDAADAVEGLSALASAVGADRGLAALGLAEADLDRAAEQVARRRPEVTVAQARMILKTAMDPGGSVGPPPSVDAGKRSAPVPTDAPTRERTAHG